MTRTSDIAACKAVLRRVMVRIGELSVEPEEEVLVQKSLDGIIKAVDCLETLEQGGPVIDGAAVEQALERAIAERGEDEA